MTLSLRSFSRHLSNVRITDVLQLTWLICRFLSSAYSLAGSGMQVRQASAAEMFIHNKQKAPVPLLLPDDGRGLRVLIVVGSASLISLLEDHEPDRKAAGNPSWKVPTLQGSLTANPQSTGNWLLGFRAISSTRKSHLSAFPPHSLLRDGRD